MQSQATLTICYFKKAQDVHVKGGGQPAMGPLPDPTRPWNTVWLYACEDAQALQWWWTEVQQDGRAGGARMGGGAGRPTSVGGGRKHLGTAVLAPLDILYYALQGVAGGH